MNHSKIIGYKQIFCVLNQRDGECYKHFKTVLEAKFDIRKGKEPKCGYHEIMNSIAYVDLHSTNLRNYIGFLKANKLILETHAKLINKKQAKN